MCTLCVCVFAVMHLDACQDASKAAQPATCQHHPFVLLQHLPLWLVLEVNQQCSNSVLAQSFEDVLLVIVCYYNDVKRDVASRYVIVKVQLSRTKESLVNISSWQCFLCGFQLQGVKGIATNCRSLHITCSTYRYDMLERLGQHMQSIFHNFCTKLQATHVHVSAGEFPDAELVQEAAIAG